jgi:cellulose synthase operon protein C
MMHFQKPLRAVLLAAALFLAACDTAEERAERFFQSGMSYLQAGDVDRALVEFRNVFKLNGKHREARLAYADAERKRGNLREAYSQYLRLVEQYPDDLQGLRTLAQMAADNAQWNDADRFVTSGLGAAPDDAEFKALRVFADYGKALEANSPAQIRASVHAAKDMRTAQPDNLLLRKIVIDDLIRSQSLDEALAELDAAIALAPQEQLLYAQRLSVYAARGDDQRVERGLIEMVGTFPDSREMREALLRWYLTRKEFDKAEAHLRAQIDAVTDGDEPEIALVRFLGEFRGADAAIAELDKVIGAGKSGTVFRSARAGFRFDKGEREAAVAEMEDILATNPTGDDARNVRVGLARMQLAVGNSVAARALVEEVLAEDSGLVEAVKLKATWLILDDQVGDAVALLRDAIDQNPGDPALMTLMAQAYERDGNRDLMRDMLSQAVVASGRGPAESLRFAQLLASEGKLIPAEGVIIEALRLAPGDLSLLVPLGQIYVALKDWPRADAVARELDEIDEPAIAGEVVELRAAILEGEQKSGEAASYLETFATSEGAQLDAKVAVLRNHLSNGRADEALAFAARILSEDPGNLDLQYVNGSVQATVGDPKAAELAYRSIIEQDPNRGPAWMGLFRIVSRDPERGAEAMAVLDQALAALPNSGELRWARAGTLEAAGDIEGAISVYEVLYKENSANPIVANNLASLLSNYRKDPESLARAEVIARRLKGSDLPPYQDTYGWIAYLTGNYAEALEELEKAAAGLPEDPTVQYHLAMTYLALDRPADAADKFGDVLALVPEGDSREFAAAARAELEKLEAAPIAD